MRKDARFRPWKHRFRVIREWPSNCSIEGQGEKYYAFAEYRGCPDGGWRAVVPGEPVRPHGLQHQINSECGGSDCRGGLGLAGCRIVGRSY